MRCSASTGRSGTTMVAECLAQKKDAQDKFFAILRRLIRELKAKRKAEQALADDL